VRFRHPLVRSAVYRAAPPQERLDAHRALADAIDPASDPDRRAWHLARATAGLDEAVAAALERSAERARARGGLGAAGAFRQRAAELTPDPARRARRALAAAHTKHLAGAPDAALHLLATARAGPLGEHDQARAELVQAQVTSAMTRGRDAPALLLHAAQRLAPLDAALAREATLDAFAAAVSAGRLARGPGARDVAQAVVTASTGRAPRRPPRAADLLLDGMAVLSTAGYGAGAPLLQGALAAFLDEPAGDDGALRWLWLACRVARALADDTRWAALAERQARLARRAGALALLPGALDEHAGAQLLCGRLTTAAAAAAEADAVATATGSPVRPHSPLWLVLWRTDEADALAPLAAARSDAIRRGEGLWLAEADAATTVLHLGLGRYEEALTAAERVAEAPGAPVLSSWTAPELIEAAARSGNGRRAAGAAARLTEIARACGTDWALGLEARSRALLAEGEAAEALYREAVERLGRTRIRVALARAHLLYGEWLRRENRRVDGREQLRVAHALVTEMGAQAFADRARRELLATGETVRKRTADTLDELTSQEAHIAVLAAGGQTNPEIGAELFISPRTVEWHLRKVYAKLAIGSRKELGGALAAAQPVP
jgi:DNA-binding CsgD family transcriptional regulator